MITLSHYSGMVRGIPLPCNEVRDYHRRRVDVLPVPVLPDIAKWYDKSLEN